MANKTTTSRANIHSPPDMTCLSASYELSYWRSLSLQHCLNPMHILKNVCKYFISHLMGEQANIAARRDLEFSNTKQQLWPIVDGEVCTIKTNYILYIIPQ